MTSFLDLQSRPTVTAEIHWESLKNRSIFRGFKKVTWVWSEDSPGTIFGPKGLDILQNAHFCEAVGTFLTKRSKRKTTLDGMKNSIERNKGGAKIGLKPRHLTQSLFGPCESKNRQKPRPIRKKLAVRARLKPRDAWPIFALKFWVAAWSSE